jgi:lipopolysaccharide assembly outer membrane protein LptD (OstA)
MTICGQNKTKLDLQHADEMEVLLSKLQDTTVVIGAVVFQSDEGMIYCDSAVWLRGKRVKLMGKVVIDDPAYHLAADSVDYDLITEEAVARGSYVELWSRDDSLFAVGHHAFYNRQTRYFNMQERPTIYIRYPDTANMIEVVSDFVEYDAQQTKAQASGNVVISSKDINATSGCAVMRTKEGRLDLLDKPVAHRGRSTISGELLRITTLRGVVAQIDVVDSADGDFVEDADSVRGYFDSSKLKGRRIIMDFDSGELSHVTCYGQAYSWYNPSPRGKSEFDENSVSGDTITFDIQNEKLRKVNVIRGAMGRYISGKAVKKDTSFTTMADTVDYSGEFIDYNLADSMITLQKSGHVMSASVVLDAYRIAFDTHKRIVEAYSASVENDSTRRDSSYTAHLQPNAVPVVLKDKEETLYGDYLQYDIDTKKGRIVQSKSPYLTGFYYGDKVYRSTSDIFYIDYGRFTTCDEAEPHFHFYSKHLKLMENNKLIAKPVVLYIGRLPILALPYYVFPLRKGRHSGFLPFNLGNIEQGQRYIRNVGYYWAPSDHWDFRSSIDYYERQHTINFNNTVNYKVLYAFEGNLSGNYTRQVSYNSDAGREQPGTRWLISGAHNQQFSPTFRISAYGQFQSDANYQKDFSADLSAHLNRSVTSRVNFEKRFSKSLSLTGSFSDVNNLDARTRTDNLPTMNMQLPTIFPFGSGKLNAEGILERKWYNNFSFTNGLGLFNYALRGIKVADTTDTLTTGRKYTRVNHSAGLSFSSGIAKYIRFTPSLSYSEAWYKIYRTDQSDSVRISTTPIYHSYIYSFNTALSTSIYGTVYPKLFGLSGLRQVLTPSIGYGFTPKINRHPEIRNFAGGGPGSAATSQSINVSLGQLYQAKVKKGEGEQSLSLLSINSSFSYDFEKDSLKFSELSTNFQSNVLPNLRFNGSMMHSFYSPGTADLHFFSPYLESFSFSTDWSITGKSFLFDDLAAPVPKALDTTAREQQVAQAVAPATASAPSGYSLNVYWTYNESGRGSTYTRSSFISFNMRFNLSPSATVSYSQSYDLSGKGTANNQVTITKSLHCWSGMLYWVPIGSTRGYGFRLWVNALPDIKIDNSQNAFSAAYSQVAGR